MKLSEFNVNNLTDEILTKVVFSGVEDDNKSSKYGIVLGHYQVQKYRVKKAVELYHAKRIKKIIFSGGIGGFANHTNETIPEAVKMKNMAIELGVNEADIIVEDTSNSTIENFENVLKILKHLKEIDNLDRLILISSEFHMKRCREIAKKIFPSHIEYTLAPAKDGFSDKENWFLSEYKRDSGRFYVYWEGKILIENAQKGTIEDIEV